MREARLKSKLFVQALLHRCTMAATAAYVVTVGDADAGAIFVKVIKADRTALVLSPVHSDGGEGRWREQSYGDEAAADAFLARQRGYDGDLWVIEIESRDGQHPLLDSLIKD